MSEISLDSIKDKLNIDNYLSEGKEVKCYRDNNEVIKIFHEERKSTLDMINEEGFKKLSDLQLKHFNKPIRLIYDGDKLVGYTEKYLEIEDYDNSKIDINYFLEILSEIKEDIRILSNNGFQLEDFYYNYTFDGGNLTFFDLTCYKYLTVKNDYVRDFYYKKNIKMMNTFLVGLIYFGAFKHGEKNEYTKIYKANEFLTENGINEYIGDYIIEKMNNSSNDIKLD